MENTDTKEGKGIGLSAFPETVCSAWEWAESYQPPRDDGWEFTCDSKDCLQPATHHVEDHDRNTTRFLIMAREPDYKRRGNGTMMTTFVFRVRNIPAALYKAMGGFATNGVNMTKLESYLVDGGFVAAQFYAEVEGHPQQPNLVLAFEELAFFSDEVRILGTYPQGAFRKRAGEPG